jgi:hypothetical protein
VNNIQETEEQTIERLLGKVEEARGIARTAEREAIGYRDRVSELTAENERLRSDRDSWHQQAIDEGKSKLSVRRELKAQESATQQLSAALIAAEARAPWLEQEKRHAARCADLQSENERLRAEKAEYATSLNLYISESHRLAAGTVSRLATATALLERINTRGGCGLDVHGWIDAFLTNQPAAPLACPDSQPAAPPCPYHAASMRCSECPPAAPWRCQKCLGDHAANEQCQPAAPARTEAEQALLDACDAAELTDFGYGPQLTVHSAERIAKVLALRGLKP